ncbi:YqgE/AlgH family protein [Nitrogeniibacter aestuarii]|uniref:YqgE/AlgH family protein n=1 Tax=Nitrogeniibacter aestuarii TaxID=2815343 RepID=UPI001D11AF50|nr:YqgE/AlgH family protein [Nitrogeniibacter aestuarii]
MNLTNHFLIAMPLMDDPNFARTLTYVAEHSDRGALGIIVNRPIDMDLANLFERIEIPLTDPTLARQPVFYGGPVQTDRGFVLHRPAGNWNATLSVNEEIGMTSSRDILEAVAGGLVEQDILVSLGYAGWDAGQLEQELAENAWLSTPADPSIIFDLPPEERLVAAMQSMGIDFTNLSEDAGHA